MAKVLVGILFVLGLGYAAYWGCVSCASIDGADLAERPCSPVLSNGDANPHYRNSWRACSETCERRNASPSLELTTCNCECR